MICKDVFYKIDELYEKYLDILEEACNIESPTEYKEGVDNVGAYFTKLAEEKGWDIEVSKQEKAVGGSDAAYITQCGIPCVDSFGPRGGRGHSIDEYIEMETLKESAKRYASIICSI